MVKNADYEDM